MQIQDVQPPGVKLIQPRIFRDDRGLFFEGWKKTAYQCPSLGVEFVQFNVSKSSKGILRGLHYQYPNPQGKLVSVLDGAIYDVAIDIRRGSPNYLQWQGFELDSNEYRQLYIPEGFAHGFIVLSDSAIVNYLCTQEYDAEADAVIAWNDPDIAIDWPINPTGLSDKDEAAPSIAEIDPVKLPVFSE